MSENGNSVASKLKKLLEVPRKRAAIFAHAGPDPDALGSMMAVHWLLSKFNIESDLFYSGHISHPQNIAMVNLLDPNLRTIEEYSPEHFDFHILVDTVPKNAGIGNHKIDFDVVFDHHKENCAVDYDGLFINFKAGSCCGTIYHVLKEMGFTFVDGNEADAKIVTALLIGVSTDTENLMSDDCSEYEIGMSRGEDLSRILGEERAGLVDLAKRIGVDERDASRLENIVTRYERQINEVLVLDPGGTMAGYRSANAANVGKADSPFHEVWDATQTTFKRLDREAEDLIPVSDAGFIDPEPLPPSLKQKQFAQDLFHVEGITQADLRRILNDEVTDTEAYQIIGRAKNTATVGQAKTAWKMYDEGRLTMGEFTRIVNRKYNR